MGKRNKPKIRFKGFTDEWEQRKLGDTLYSLQNNTLSRAELTYEKGSIKNVHYGDILVKYGEVIDVKNEQMPNIIDNTIAEKYKASFLQNGDVIFADTAEDETVGKCSEIAGLTDETVLAGLHTIPYRPQLKFATGYLGYYLSSGTFHQQLVPLMQGIKVTSISKSAMQNTDIIYPKSVDEQEKIGTYFRNLDQLITLHQRKCEKLKLLKEAMLEKLFPRSGEKNPEIRFKGFTGDWKQCKLRDIADKVKEKNTNLAVSETFTNSAEYGVISQRDFFDHDVSNAENIGGYYVVGEGDFVYNPRISVSAPVGPINRNRLGRKGVMSPLYTVFRPHDIDCTFLEYFFKGSKWHSYMYFNGDTGARFDRFSIRNEVFFDMPIPYPQPEEQKAIGRYMEQTDRLIVLHQRKYEKLKLFKEAMLDKMFV